jgi:tetratricopeptide (TPR) repeat protein
MLEAGPERADVLSLLGNVEYQRGRSDAAVRLIESAIRLDPSSSACRISLGHVYRRMGDLARASRCYRQALDLSPGSALAAISLALALKGLGESRQAIDVLHTLLARDPNHPEGLRTLADLRLELEQPTQASVLYRRLLALDPGSAEVAFRLGVALSRDANPAAAIASFERALALRPDLAEAAYNIGVIEAERQHLGVAEAWLRRALSITPDYVDAHVNLSAVLLKAGRPSDAKVHRELAYRRQCLFVRPARSARRTVLVLFDAGKGNINLSHLFAPAHNTVIDWMIEYAPPGQSEALPAFDLVFNAMGDPDMTGAAAAPATRFVAACGKPVLNRPEAVARTSREKIPALLGGVKGLFVPKVWRVSPDDPWPADVAEHLPVLVRPVDSHGGAGLQRVHSADHLARIAERRQEPMYVSQFVDFASPDGQHRKYRVIFIDRRPLPYHLAISPDWLVHYATAGMAEQPWKLQEERRFLDDPPHVLGRAGMAAVTAIGARMDLDYAGVDFSILPDGRILVFEANPVMLVHPEAEPGIFAFKNRHVTKIFDAFEALLTSVVSVPGGAGVQADRVVNVE